MSGHSKWDTIKHKKAANDQKKGKVFSKYAQLMTVAAREGGADMGMNHNLRLLVEKAKADSMPIANIERAIDRGIGKGAEGPVIFDNVSYEGFGPEGVSLIVDVLTENRNRAVAEVRNIFNEGGGSLGQEGSVSWNFEVKGMITVRAGKIVKAEKYGAPDVVKEFPKEDVLNELLNIEGIIDIEEIRLDAGDGFEVFTRVENMSKVRDSIFALGYIVISAEIVKVAKMFKQFTPEQLEKILAFIDKIDDYPDVHNVWSDIDPESLKALPG